MKKNNYITLIIILAITFLLAWYLFNSFLSVIIVLALATYSYFNIKKYKYNWSKEETIINNIYQFTNLMNVSMISSLQIYEAYKQCENFLPLELTNYTSETFTLSLNDIAQSYQIKSFDLYIKTMIIYDQDGGNYQKMQKSPSSLIQKSKIYYAKLFKEKQKKMFEVSTLYVLWLLVILFLRMSLNDYYLQLISSVTGNIMMLIFVIIGIFTYTNALKKLYANKIRGL